ncbi:hypothetical protein ES708_28656 [subsurface metagenome]
MANYLIQKEEYGKANPIYSLIRREVIIKNNLYNYLEKYSWGADMLFVFSLLCYGNIEIINKVMHKCIVGNVKNYQQNNNQIDLRKKYFSGYREIMQNESNLNDFERLLFISLLKIREGLYLYKTINERILHKIIHYLKYWRRN